MELNGSPDDVWCYSPEASVSFLARKLRSARVVWLNASWFASLGYATGTPGDLAELSLHIVRNYAFVVPRPEDPESAFTDETKLFFADRYGDAGTVTHGGSGRAASWRSIQVKGVGRTPLVGVDANWLHAHGCLWLEEAIREVIFSELFAQESPGGSVPVIAVIDTLLHAEMPPGAIGERRALLLRPAVPRAAHMLRATHFTTMHDTFFQQRCDATRCVDASKYFHKLMSGPRRADVLSLSGLNASVAKFISFCEVFRLSSGGVNASTVALDGRVIDFGGARWLPDWRRARLAPGMPHFGDDVLSWQEVIRALCHAFNKGGHRIDHQDVINEFLEYYRQSWEMHALKLWGCAASPSSQAATRIAELTWAIFRSQQKHTYSIGEPPRGNSEWIHDDLVRLSQGRPAIGNHRVYLDEIVRELINVESMQSQHRTEDILLPSIRHTRPRPMIHRESLQEALFDSVVPRHPGQILRLGAIDDVLCMCLSDLRRYVP